MRCSNCGWENAADASRCVKCNAPLASNSGTSSSRASSSSYPSEDSSRILRGTVPEGQIFGSEPVSDYGKPMGSVCPKCGYPLGRGISSCPRCGSGLQATQREQEIPENHSRAARPGTVNPWSRPQDQDTCSLTPVPWEGDTEACASVRYSGRSVVLNRANTDPSNNTITSKVQAELVRENDGWYIVDKSDLQTTFVHAGRKTKLEDGDIVILGNRRFVFKG